MIKFGTSGFRGIMGENFTKKTVQQVAVALCEYLKKSGATSFAIPVGFDNRFMGKEYAEWFSCVVASLGYKVKFYTESVPSTLIAFQTKNKPLGVMLSASHNPYYYNGLKVFIEGGREPDNTITDEVEKRANAVDLSVYSFLDFSKLVEDGKIEIVYNVEDYCDYIVDFVGDKNIGQSNISVLVNIMHGSTLRCLEYIFGKLNLKNYVIMNKNIDPYFNNMLPAPYKKNLSSQVELMQKDGYDFGFALDGDGDRISFIDKDGSIFDCNYIVVLLYYYLVREKGFSGDLVANTAFTTLAKKVVEKEGGSVREVRVGFKNVANEILSSNAFLGAESNGIAFKGHILHKDGIFIALLLLDMLAGTKQSMGEVIRNLQKMVAFESEVVEHSYEITDTHKEKIYNHIFVEKHVPAMSYKVEKVQYLDGVKFLFENGYWAMIRFSGNESVVRIFVEAKNLDDCEKIVAEIEADIEVSIRQ